MRLLPPLSPATRTRRLLDLTLRDLRRLTKGRIPRSPADWESQVYGRLFALPEEAEPLQRAQLLAALELGAEIIHLRRIARRFHFGSDLDMALDAVARGNSALTTGHLARVDRHLAAVPSDRPGRSIRLRARGSIRDMSQALSQHAAYFNSQARQ
jgi:hypothetical protein